MTTLKFKKINIEAYKPGKSSIRKLKKIIKAYNKEIAKEEGKIILFSSHDLALIENVAETCWVINNNKIEASNSITDTIVEYTSRDYKEEVLIEN